MKRRNKKYILEFEASLLEGRGADGDTIGGALAKLTSSGRSVFVRLTAVHVAQTAGST